MCDTIYLLTKIYKNLLNRSDLNLKKAKIISISILGTLLLLSFSNFATAAPPSYVGIRTGESYTWSIDPAMENINATGIALFGVTNWTFMYEYFVQLWENMTYCPFNFFQGVGMKLVLTNVSDEITLPYYSTIPVGSAVYFDEYVSYCNNNYTLVYNSSGSTYPMMYIYDPTYLNSTNWMYYIAGGTPVFTSVGLNWALVAASWQTYTLTSPYTSGNVTITPLSNGLKINLKAVYLEWLFNMMSGGVFTIGSLSDADITLTWNAKGVFSKGIVEYGGIELVNAYLVGEEPGIPGYELPLLIGTSAFTTIGLIYTIMRKKK